MKKTLLSVALMVGLTLRLNAVADPRPAPDSAPSCTAAGCDSGARQPINA